MNLPTELLNVLGRFKVSPDSMARRGSDLVIECNSMDDADDLQASLAPMFQATITWRAGNFLLTVHDVVQ